MLVNSNKERQDKRSAMLTRVGDIVELRYNESEEQIEFYSNDGFLGSTTSKQKIEGYALVKKVEALFKGYHFTFEYAPFLSKKDFIQAGNKKEKIIQRNIKNMKAKDEKWKKEKIIKNRIKAMKAKEENKNKEVALERIQLIDIEIVPKRRETICWKCREPLFSDTHRSCSTCGWLICSCGACRARCSAHEYQEIKLLEITDNKYQENILSKPIGNKYKKCSVDGCIAQIPTDKVIEWNGRCPPHKNY